MTHSGTWSLQCRWWRGKETAQFSEGCQCCWSDGQTHSSVISQTPVCLSNNHPPKWRRENPPACSPVWPSAAWAGWCWRCCTSGRTWPGQRSWVYPRRSGLLAAGKWLRHRPQHGADMETLGGPVMDTLGVWGVLQLPSQWPSPVQKLSVT